MNKEVFVNYLELGWHHIISVSAFDHISFVITLCALFTVSEWRKILTLVTAFTIGHSITLALSGLNYLPFSSKWVEILIPITIIVTAVRNILQKEPTKFKSTFDRRIVTFYFTALFFGFIHGMGFASSFRLMSGAENSILIQLFGFNLGLELGQIVIVITLLLILYFTTRYFHIGGRAWNLFVSGSGFGIALMILINNLSS